MSDLLYLKDSEEPVYVLAFRFPFITLAGYTADVAVGKWCWYTSFAVTVWWRMVIIEFVVKINKRVQISNRDNKDVIYKS